MIGTVIVSGAVCQVDSELFMVATSP